MLIWKVGKLIWKGKISQWKATLYRFIGKLLYKHIFKILCYVWKIRVSHKYVISFVLYDITEFYLSFFWKYPVLLPLVSHYQIPYIETSAKDPPLNVDAAFHEVVRVIRAQPIDLKDTRRKRRRGKLSQVQCSIL